MYIENYNYKKGPCTNQVHRAHFEQPFSKELLLVSLSGPNRQGNFKLITFCNNKCEQIAQQCLIHQGCSQHLILRKNRPKVSYLPFNQYKAESVFLITCSNNLSYKIHIHCICRQQEKFNMQ